MTAPLTDEQRDRLLAHADELDIRPGRFPDEADPRCEQLAADIRDLLSENAALREERDRLAREVAKLRRIMSTPTGDA